MNNHMRKISNGAWSAPRALLCALSLGLSSLAVTGTAFAEEPAHQFSERAGGAVNEALIFAENEKYQKAIDVLQVELAGNDLKAYEFGVIYQMLGQYNYELDRVPQSIAAFENAVSSGGLKTDERENLKLVIAQLMIGSGQYKEGAERLETQLNAGGNTDSKYVDLLVNAWVQAEDYPRALPWAETWFEAAEPKERKHYDLLNFLYNNLDLKAEQADLRKVMEARWPER